MPMPSGSGHALLRRLVALLPPFSSITNSPPARSSHFVLLPLPRRIFSFFGGNGRGEAQEQFRRLERHQALSQWRSLRLATCVIQPIDMVKVRIQLRQGSAVQVPKNMLAQEGFGAFYKVLQPLHREMGMVLLQKSPFLEMCERGESLV